MAITILTYQEKIPQIKIVQLTQANQSDVLALVRQYVTVTNIIVKANDVNFNANGVACRMSFNDYVGIDSKNNLVLISQTDLDTNYQIVT